MNQRQFTYNASPTEPNKAQPPSNFTRYSVSVGYSALLMLNFLAIYRAIAIYLVTARMILLMSPPMLEDILFRYIDIFG
jgi:hypothetical protein